MTGKALTSSGAIAAEAVSVVGTLTSVTEYAVMCADDALRHDWMSSQLGAANHSQWVTTADFLNCGPHCIFEREVITTAWREVTR